MVDISDKPQRNIYIYLSTNNSIIIDELNFNIKLFLCHGVQDRSGFVYDAQVHDQI